MFLKSLPGAVLGLALAGLSLPASAAPVLDAQGDWYAGSVAASHRPDLDVRSADGVYEDGVGWHLTATMDGDIDKTFNSAYVWGFGRGSSAAVAPFAGEGNVRFDSVLSISPLANTATVRLFDTSVSSPLAATDFSINGPNITAFIPEAFLPTVAGGFSDDEFTWNLWPRIAGGASTNISDFAPDNAMQPFINVPAGAIPEPGSIALLASALPLAALGLRKRSA